MPNGERKNSPCSRKETTVNRLREQLRRKREALADHFDYLIYLAFVFRDKVSLFYIKTFRFSLATPYDLIERGIGFLKLVTAVI